MVGFAKLNGEEYPCYKVEIKDSNGKESCYANMSVESVTCTDTTCDVEFRYGIKKEPFKTRLWGTFLFSQMLIGFAFTFLHILIFIFWLFGWGIR